MKLIQIEENIGGQQYKGLSNYFINFEGKTRIRPKNALGNYSLAKNIEKKLKPGDEVTVKADWSSTPLVGHVIEVSIKKIRAYGTYSGVRYKLQVVLTHLTS